MKVLAVIAAAGLAGAAWGASAARVNLATDNTSLVLGLTNGTWTVLHYGARVADAADVAALDRPGFAPNRMGVRKSAAYSVYGADTLNGMNAFGGLAVQHADGTMSTELKGAAAAAEEMPDGRRRLVLEMTDAARSFHVTQHFVADPASDTVETWIEIRHEEKGPVRLLRMDTVALTLPNRERDVSVLSLTGHWASESQLSVSKVARGQSVRLTSRSGVRSAWNANPAWMAGFGPVTETAGRVVGCVLAWDGSSASEIARDPTDVIELRAGVETANGYYTLEPGRELVLPKAVLTYSEKGRGQVSRNFHRWARDRHLPHGHDLRDVLLNSWEGSRFAFTEKTLLDMMDHVRAMGGEMFVLDDGWFGSGEFARDDRNRATAGLGDWVCNPEKLPRGLAALADEAVARGLKFGLWFEPEMANTRSWLVERHRDWILSEPDRPLRGGRGGTQVVLDLANPAVRDNVSKQLADVVKATPNLSYVKWDANADFMNPGSPSLPRDRQGNLWFDYTAGYYDILGRLRRIRPDLVIQACASGGGHMSYGSLAYCDEFWVSDNTDAHDRVYMQWGAGMFYPACAQGAHVTASPNQRTKRTTPLKFRFDVAMTGRMGFELHPKDMTPEEVVFSRAAVADYKRIRPIVQQGDLYRLVSPYEEPRAALMYVSADKSRAVVFQLGLRYGLNHDEPLPLRLEGLDAARRYRVVEINRSGSLHVKIDGKTLRGDALMGHGVEILQRGDFDSAVLELTAVPDGE